MTHSDRLATGGTLTGQPYRPTRRDNSLAFLISILGVGSCVGLLLAAPR